jgi:hypothetical protein
MAPPKMKLSADSSASVTPKIVMDALPPPNVITADPLIVWVAA